MVVLQVIGGGKMGEALIVGLLRAGSVEAADVRVVEPGADRRDALRAALPGVEVATDPGPADGTVIAVKPPDVPAACGALTAPGRVLSIAAGVTLGALERDLPAGTRVVRAMPNTPALVGVGAAAIAAGTEAGDDDLAWAESLLGAVGTVVRVEEPLLDAVTGVSGSGPAYLFFLAETLLDAAASVGLPADVAEDLVVQTLLGAATLLARSDEGAEALRAAVTSRGGTTAAAMEVLEQREVRAAFVEAVEAATERSRQLGG